MSNDTKFNPLKKKKKKITLLLGAHRNTFSNYVVTLYPLLVSSAAVVRPV